jgi:hypothetical protein
MVGWWGMSEEVGAVSILPDSRLEQPLSVDGSGPSPTTREPVDAEARRILEECHTRAPQILRDNRQRLDGPAATLLTRETLDAVDTYPPPVSGLPQQPLRADANKMSVRPLVRLPRCCTRNPGVRLPRHTCQPYLSPLGRTGSLPAETHLWRGDLR